MKRWTMLCLTTAILTLAGCGGAPANPGTTPAAQTAPPSQAPVPRSEPVVFQQCGHEANRHGEGYDPAARSCLWQAVNDGKAAEFTTMIYTTEGDPITYTIQALAPGHGPGPRFAVLVDSKDKFGKQGQFQYACTSLKQVAYQQAPQRYGFALAGCTGTDDEKAVHIP